LKVITGWSLIMSGGRWFIYIVMSIKNRSVRSGWWDLNWLWNVCLSSSRGSCTDLHVATTEVPQHRDKVGGVPAKPPSMKQLLTTSKAILLTGLWAYRVVRIEEPTFSTQSAHRWRWNCQPQRPAALYSPGKFLLLISVRGWVDPRA
jgi:hypothetical protein